MTSDVVVDVLVEQLSPNPIGRLTSYRARGKEAISFTYDNEALASWPLAFPLDPALPLVEGPTHLNRLPGTFADSAPDRWGELLLDRKEAIVARRDGRPARSLSKIDYLLGVSDRTRMGGLRFRHPKDGAFLADDQLSVPPETSLREIQHYVEALEARRPIRSPDAEQWIMMLIDPGSSLGGSRPKATYRDLDGALWLAKFPSRMDTTDVGAWEYVATKLAASAGVIVPPTKLIAINDDRHVFCAQRFERHGEDRVLYASAMTLTHKQDHEPASYLDIAGAIARYAPESGLRADLEQMFRRAAFNILIAHRDDHLRNHGFLLNNGQWELAPAFDINPLPEKLVHDLAIDDQSTEPDIEALLSTADFYQLDVEKGVEIVEEVRTAIRGLVATAQTAGIERSSAKDMLEAIESSFPGVGI